MGEAFGTRWGDEKCVQIVISKTDRKWPRGPRGKHERGWKDLIKSY